MAKVTKIDGREALFDVMAERLTLEAMSFGKTFCVSCNVAHEISGGVVQMIKWFTDQLSEDIIRMSARWYCPANHRQTIEYPVNWKEAVKERFAPAWVIACWPVKRQVHKVYEMFPEVEWPKHQRCVMIQSYGKPRCGGDDQ